MNADKQVQEKKRLIRWFLLTRQFKQPAVSRLLRWLLFNEQLLYQTTLTDDKSLSNMLMITDSEADGHSFYYRQEDDFFYDVDQVLRLLEEDFPERLYLNLTYCNQVQEQISLCCQEAVVYDYQNTDRSCEKKNNVYIPVHNKKAAVRKVFQLLAREYQERQQRKNCLWQKIDNSLDQRDQQQFARLVEELQKLA